MVNNTDHLQHIEPTLRPLAVPINQIHNDQDNVRKHPDQNLDSIRRSLEAFGQQKPIVIDKHHTCLAGNGTLDGGDMTLHAGNSKLAQAGDVWVTAGDYMGGADGVLSYRGGDECFVLLPNSTVFEVQGSTAFHLSSPEEALAFATFGV